MPIKVRNDLFDNASTIAVVADTAKGSAAGRNIIQKPFLPNELILKGRIDIQGVHRCSAHDALKDKGPKPADKVLDLGPGERRVPRAHRIEML